MSQNPYVNILICNHNYGEWIVDCIESALKQTHPNVGIVLVDDCSTDDSWDLVLNTFMKNHKRVLPSTLEIRESSVENGGVVRKFTAIRLDKNYGPSVARNVGIFHSLQETDFYCILDADDIIYPDKVEKLLEYISITDYFGVAYADYHTLNTETKKTVLEVKPKFSVESLYQECIVHSGSLIRKTHLVKVIENECFYDKNLRVCEDYDLWLRLSDVCGIIHCPEPLSLVRVTPVSSTHSVKKEVWQQNYQHVFNKLRARKNGK
jgi:glycosyltransferase involved in cell wall biosynthesis